MSVLKGIRVLEFEGIGPGPFGGMLLADMGADVLRVDRHVPHQDLGSKSIHGEPIDVLGRGRRSVTLDLKRPAAQAAALTLMARADVVIEGFRPGVMERLGLGPDVALARHPQLVYARMTGWGQDGPMAARAGHDLNYLALSGLLDSIGEDGRPPVPPLNLVADFGGGGMLLAMGVLAALLHVQRGGVGQVVDAAMVEGSAQLGSMFWGMLASGNWREQRASNVLDGGAPWYATYATQDGRYIAVGAIERRFYAELLDKLGLADAGLPAQHDRAGWPQLRARFAAVFRTRTRDDWAAHFADSDACVAPVLKLGEAQDHPHNRARGSFVQVAGVSLPRPAPRFSVTPSAQPRPAPKRGEHGEAALRDWGFDAAAIEALRAGGLHYAA